jgi:hypothetical protein
VGIRTTRAMLGCAVIFALCAVGVSVPTSVRADTHCMQWRFDGYTQLDHANGSKLKFVAFFESSVRDRPARIVPGNGGQSYEGVVGADIANGDRIYLDFRQSGGVPPGGPQPLAHYEGGVADDGFAYGIVYDDGYHTSGSWRSAAPLRCAD